MRLDGFVRMLRWTVVTATILACSGDNTTSSEPPPQGLDRLTVRLSVERDSLLLGTSRQFAATVVNQYNVTRSSPVLWSSTNAAILTVTSQGIVTAIGPGLASIVASIQGSADTVLVSVYGLPGTLTVMPEAVTLPIGDEVQVVAGTRENLGAYGQTVTWRSSDTSVAVVDASGLVAAVGEGSVSIIANVGANFAKAGVEVFTPQVKSVTVSPAVSSIAVGASVNLTAAAKSETGRRIGGRLAVTWAVSDESIATISETGRVTAKARGFVNVFATILGRTGMATVNVTPPPAASLTVSMPDSSLLEGEVVSATAVVKDAKGNVMTGITLAWQSSNPSVATVDASGRVRAVASGSTTVSAISSGIVASIPVNVSKGLASSLVITPTAPSLVVGGTAQLLAQVLDQNGQPVAGQSFMWSSSNASVATVSATGVVTGLAGGLVDITATAGQFSATVRANVTALAVASLSVTPANDTLQESQTLALTASPRDANGNLLVGRVISWSTSDPTILTVNSAGSVTALRAGKATVTASVEGKSAASVLTVTPKALNAVASVELVANASALNIGQSTQATATARDATGAVLTGYSVAWTSLDPSIASVSATGMITAVSGGSVAIIATAGGVKGSLSITVNTPEATAVASVTIALSPSQIATGQLSKAAVTLKDALGNTLSGRTVSFSSSRVTVASVGAGGSVTGVSSGEAGITATSEGKSGKAFISVTGEASVARVSVSVPSTALAVGSTMSATATAYDAGGHSIPSSFIWSTSSPAVISVSSSGALTAHAEGSATITATSTSNGISGSIGVSASTVSTSPVATVSLTLGSSSLSTGQTTQATAVAKDANGVLLSVSFTYSSSNTAVATVGSSGKVTGVGAGSATITATGGGKYGSSTLSVVTAPPAPTAPPLPSTPGAALALIGPTVSPAAATALGGGYAKYDALWLKWEPTRWAAEGASWSSNYYDRVQIYYAQWIRTGDATYKQRGDAIALDYRRNYLHANNYQTSPHWAQLDGIALHYYLNGDDSSRTALGKAAWNLSGTALWPRNGQWVEARQQARALIGMLLAWQMNAPNAPAGGWAKALDDGLNNILPQQSADGGWRYPVTSCDLALNYMNAMLADALIRVYTHYRPDPRIPNAVKKTADFLWTQWRPSDPVPSFNYYEATCTNQAGTGTASATPDLTGLFTSLYAWMAGQDPTYQAKSDAVFMATMNGMYPVGSKQFNQAFAFGWRAMGYLP